MSDSFQFRPGSMDAAIFAAVVEHNEYALPEAFRSDDVIVDIGMHIGSFCHAAALRGAGAVYGFEADAANYALASANLKRHGGRVSTRQQAIWRSDQGPTTLRFFRPEGLDNTGGGNVVWAEGDQEVDAVPLDPILDEITRNGRRRVRLLKIDCEGSEFPILLTSKRLHLIDEIAGEYHEFAGDHDPYPIPHLARIDGIARFTIAELTAALEAAGFTVASTRQGTSNIGLFRATRPAAQVGGRFGRFRQAVRLLTRRAG